jgi:hypothetical protein
MAKSVIVTSFISTRLIKKPTEVQKRQQPGKILRLAWAVTGVIERRFLQDQAGLQLPLFSLLVSASGEYVLVSAEGGSRYKPRPRHMQIFMCNNSLLDSRIIMTIFIIILL